MTDRTLAIVVGYLIWFVGAAIAVLGIINSDLLVIVFGSLMAIPGGLLGTHGRKLSKAQNA